MSKTNSLQKKTTGFDIMYRVVTAILAIAMFPAVYFADIFTFEIAHTGISNLLGGLNLNGEEGMEGTLHTTYDSLSLHELPQWIEMFSGFTNEDFDFKASVLQNALYRPVIVAVVFLALALVIGLVILGFAIFSNKIKVITALSASGFLCTLASYISFTGFFAEKVLAGDVTISQLFNMNGIITSAIASLLGEVILFTLDGAFFAVMFLLLGICLWSISVMIVNYSDEKEKQMKAAAKKK
jgi:hypothetical protein